MATDVLEEPEAESQRARGMPRIRGARVEPRALATSVNFVDEDDDKKYSSTNLFSVTKTRR